MDFQVNIKRLRVAAAVLFLFHFGIPVRSQDPYYYSINPEQFPVKEVYEIYQDRKNHIWIGSNNGLFRYNGNEFIQLTNPGFQVSSLSALHEDSLGRIWSRNFRGDIFVAEGDKINLFKSWKDSIQDYPSLAITGGNTAWFNSRNGIYKYSISTGEWSFLKPENQGTLLSYGYNSAFLYAAPDSSLLVVSSRNMPLGFIRNNSLNWFANQDELLSRFSDVSVECSFNYGRSCYLLSKNRNLFRLSGDSLVFVKNMNFSVFHNNTVYWVEELRNGSLAAGTRNGLYMLDKDFNLLSGKPFFKGNKISSILEDHEGNLWLSTLNSGIFVIPQLDVTVFNSGNSSLPDNGIFTLETGNRNHLYIGFSNGRLGYFDTTMNFTVVYNPETSSEIHCISWSPENSSLYFLHQTFLSRTYGAESTINSGLIFSAPKEIKAYKYCLLISSAGGLIMVSQPEKISGFIRDLRIVPDQKFVSRADVFDGPAEETIVYSIYRKYKKARTAIIDTFNNRLWAGYNDGLYYSEGNRFIELKINGARVYANKLEMSPDSILWMATSSHGLIALKDTSLFIRKETGNPVITLYLDGDDLWYATIEGLYRYRKTSGELLSYHKYDGIASHEISSVRVLNERVMLGTPEGLVSFPKHKDFTNRIPPRIEIESVAIWEKDTLLQDSYTLPFFRNNVSIRFNGIALKSKGEFSVSYRMLGLNDSWVTVPGSNNVARFPSMPPGLYRFQVKAINEDGTESDAPAEIRFDINPPFWEKWWFYGLILGLVSALISLFFLIRIKILRRRAMLEKQLKASEIIAIKAQMNPHFIFNALNSIQDLVLQKEIRNSSTYLGMFSDLLRLVLEVSGEDFISLSREKEILETYLNLEKLRFMDDFNYSIETDKVHSDPDHLLLPSMIIQPYVENAIKHGLLHKSGNKNIMVRFEENDSLLVCHIIDNGIGREKAQEIKARRLKSYKPFATHANKRRIDLFNEIFDEKTELRIADLYENEIAAGTEVVISFPKRFM